MDTFAVKRFTLLAAICCLLSVITTLGIHGYFSYGSPTFEESLQFYQNKTYLINRWWVIVHCLLVVIAMWGFAILRFKKSPGYAGLGFLFFAVFSITEIFRQLLVLFYLNGLRERYLSAGDELQPLIRQSIENFTLISYSLFGLFIVAFALGNLFYGLSLLREKGWDRVLAWLLLVWFAGTILGFFNVFWEIKWLSSFLDLFSLVYQPIMRLLLAVWLWGMYKQLRRPVPVLS